MLEVHVSITGIAIFVVILLVFLVGLLVYLYPGTNKGISIPGPSASDSRDGNITDIEQAGSLHQYLNILHEEYGDIVAFQYETNLVVSISHPELFAPRSQVCEIPTFLFNNWKPVVGESSFLFATGADVFKRRDCLECELSRDARHDLAKHFMQLSQELLRKWKGLPEGQHIPLSQHMRGLAMKSVCKIMFGDYFKDDTSLIKLYKAWDMCWNEAIASSKTEPAMDQQSIDKGKRIKSLFSALREEFLAEQHGRELRNAEHVRLWPMHNGFQIREDGFNPKAELQKIMQDAIEYQWQKRGSSKENCLIASLLSASNPPLSEEQLLCDAITLYTIGIHVTTSVLTWSVYHLAKNKDVQKKLHKKLHSVKSLDVMPHTLTDIKYLRCVLKESIRHSEMFTCMGRKQDIDLTFYEHIVPKHTAVIEAVSVAMKRDDVWTEPCKFDPVRFSNDDEELPNPLSYIPFAFAASRRTPENSLVYLLASVVLAAIFRDAEVNLAGSDIKYSEASYDGLAVMPTKEELWVSINNSEKEVETIG